MIGKRTLYITIVFIIILIIKTDVIANGLFISPFYLEVDNAKVESGIAFEITIKAENEYAQKILENIDPFEDVTFEGISHSFIFPQGNGVYTMILDNLGEKELFASIIYQGNYYYTDKIKVEVIPPDYENKEIFIISELSDQTVYQNQVLIHSINLYSNDEDVTYSWDMFSNYMNIFNETIESGESYEVYAYGKKRIKTIILYDILIPGYIRDNVIASYRVTIPAEENNLEKDIIFDTGEHNLEIIPLPEENKPDRFSGLVGTLEIKSQINKSSISLNE